MGIPSNGAGLGGHPNNRVPEADIRWLSDKALPALGLSNLQIRFRSTRQTYPDIWVDRGTDPPTVTVTPEWARQSRAERRKRLVHELLHILGAEHNDRIGYSTFPDRDSYSMEVYRKIEKQAGRIR